MLINVNCRLKMWRRRQKKIYSVKRKEMKLRSFRRLDHSETSRYKYYIKNFERTKNSCNVSITIRKFLFEILKFFISVFFCLGYHFGVWCAIIIFFDLFFFFFTKKYYFFISFEIFENRFFHLGSVLPCSGVALAWPVQYSKRRCVEKL